MTEDATGPTDKIYNQNLMDGAETDCFCNKCFDGFNYEQCNTCTFNRMNENFTIANPNAIISNKENKPHNNERDLSIGVNGTTNGNQDDISSFYTVPKSEPHDAFQLHKFKTAKVVDSKLSNKNLRERNNKYINCSIDKLDQEYEEMLCRAKTRIRSVGNIYQNLDIQEKTKEKDLKKRIKHTFMRAFSMPIKIKTSADKVISKYSDTLSNVVIVSDTRTEKIDNNGLSSKDQKKPKPKSKSNVNDGCVITLGGWTPNLTLELISGHPNEIPYVAKDGHSMELSKWKKSNLLRYCPIRL